MVWIIFVDSRNGCGVQGPAWSRLLAAHSGSTASMRIVGLDTFHSSYCLVTSYSRREISEKFIANCHTEVLALRQGSKYHSMLNR